MEAITTPIESQSSDRGTSQEKKSGLSSISSRAWIVCFSAALFFFYEFIQMNMFNAIDHDLMRAFNLHAKQLGQLSAIYFYANVVFLIPAGILLDRFSTKKIILTAMGLCVIGTALFAGSNSYVVAYLCRFITGIGSAFVFLSCMRIASRWFPAQRMALVTGLIVTMAMLGGVLAQTPLTMLVQYFGWREALYIDAAFGVFILGIILFYVQDYPQGYSAREEEHKNHLAELGIWKSLKLSYNRSQNWLAAIYTCLMNTPLGLLGVVWGTPYLVQVHHLTNTQASMVVSMIFFGTIVGGPIMGHLSDTLCMRRKPMLLGAVLSLATVMLIIANPYFELYTLMGLFLVLGFVTSTQVLTYPTVAESNPPAITATAISVISLTTQGGSAILQPIFGDILQRSWDGSIVNGVPVYSLTNYHDAIMMIPIGFVIAFISAYFIKETYCKPNILNND